MGTRIHVHHTTEENTRSLLTDVVFFIFAFDFFYMSYMILFFPPPINRTALEYDAFILELKVLLFASNGAFVTARHFV